VCPLRVGVLHLFLLRFDNIQFPLLRCRLFLFACGLSDSHSLCLSFSLFLLQQKYPCGRASERASELQFLIPPPSIIYAVSSTHKQPFLLLPLLCGAIFNNLNIAPCPLPQRKPFQRENWRFFKILPTRVNQSKAFSGIL
jgi:hypothetical protein